MAKPTVDAGGGFAALSYVMRKGRNAGGLLRLYQRLRSRNTCKTCALGMGGARGGMVDEAGRFPEVCKKSVQVQAGDLAAPIPEGFFAENPLDHIGAMDSATLQSLGRLAFPILAEPGASHFRRIAWDEAYEKTADALRGTSPDRTFFYASGRASNEAAFLLQLVARAYGTSNIHNCSYYCHSASGVALTSVYGSGTASIVLEDLDRADFAMLAGANPASNHPRLVGRLVKLRRRGGRVIVVNPMRELGLVRFRIPSDPASLLLGSDVCDLYLQPHVGGDIPLFKAMLLRLSERGGVDHSFVETATSGWPAVERDLQGQRLDDLVAASGVPKEQIERAVDFLLGGERGILAWAMGLTHHRHGVDNILALSNLALARGWLGREGTGLLPIRGHSNVQGIASVGVTPRLKKAFAQKLEELYDIQIPADAGQDTFASMRAAEAGNVDATVLLGGNLYGSNPDQDWAGRALRNIPFSVSMTTHLNTGHVNGRGRTCVVLPVLARDEETQSTTQESMFNRVRRSDGGADGPGESRSEVEIVARIAEALLPADRFNWAELRSHRQLRAAIAQVVPGYSAIDEIDAGPIEFQVEGRTFHGPTFPTDDGRAHFHVTPLPEFGVKSDELRLMTVRSEGQFNTVVYEVEDLYRGNTRRDVVMMAPEDAKARGLDEGDPADVRTEVGAMRVVVALVDIRPGSIAMYFPEANRIVPARTDPRSKTPSFKSVAATVTPAT